MSKPKRLILIAFMICIGIVLQAFEGFFSFGINLPGGKIGLANIVGLVLLPLCGGAVMLTVSVLRALLGAMLFGGVTTAIYSMAGALFSSVVAIIAYRYLKRYNVTLVGVGILSAAAHNTAQVAVASFMLKSMAIFSYLPVLIIISVFSGAFTGFSAQLVCRALNKNKERF